MELSTPLAKSYGRVSKKDVCVISILCRALSSNRVNFWRGSEWASAKRATLAYGLFWAESNQDPADLWKTFTPPLITKRI